MRLSFHFEAAAPHRLIRYESGDGSVYELAKSERMAYWKMLSPPDVAWFPSDLR